jgi:hypothetical protein
MSTNLLTNPSIECTSDMRGYEHTIGTMLNIAGVTYLPPAVVQSATLSCLISAPTNAMFNATKFLPLKPHTVYTLHPVCVEPLKT